MSSSPSTERPQDVLARLLRAASAGDLAAWQPLPPGLGTAELRDLMPDVAPEPGLVSLLGQPAEGYRIGVSDHAPTGVLVWTQQDEITLLEVRDLQAAQDPVSALGEPEATVPSGLGESLNQLLWPGRGLALHVARATGRLHRLYGFPAIGLDQLLRSPLVAVAIHRRAR
jgi:hypothetical protein